MKKESEVVYSIRDGIRIAKNALRILWFYILCGMMGNSELPKNYIVYISSDFNLVEINSIEKATNTWSLYQDGPTFDFEIIDGNPCEHCLPLNVMMIRKSSLEYIEYRGGKDAVAVTSVTGTLDNNPSNIFSLPVNPDIGPTIFLPPINALYRDDYLGVVSHEIGHGMGLGHAMRGTVMCSDVECQSLEPTCDDMKQYFNIRNMESYSCNKM